MNEQSENKGKPGESAAQIVDKAMQRIALGVFLVSLSYASSALMFYVGEGIAFYLDKGKLGLGILAVIVVLPQVLKLARLQKGMRSRECEPEGFVVDVYKRAAEKGFSLTFIFLLVMDFVTGRPLPDLPAEFVVEVILSVSLAIFSLSFFVFNRDDGEDDDGFDAEPGQ